ncbi:HlyD family efflux transporter periplasmic adaptor subunit [bacterium]|nr:HlyD family efflux transporter periplasmic adaptor subunit [bacterium]
MRLWLIGLTLGLAACGCARPPLVEVTKVSRADLVDSFREQAETRLRKIYVVSVPAAGRIGRIELEPGDQVRAGQTLVSFDRLPAQSEATEHRAEVAQLQAEERLAADDAPEIAEEARAEALVSEAGRRLDSERAVVSEMEAVATQARLDLDRAATLFAQGATARQQLERAQLDERRARAQVLEAKGRLNSLKALQEAVGHQLEAARAQRLRRLHQRESSQQQVVQARERLERSLHEASQNFVTAPVTGVVVERFQQGPGPMPAGEKLLSLGRSQDLEAMSEVLTQDALRLRIGTPVQLYPGPGRPPHLAHVSRIEPRGFTKLSSLGVEQKRVRVLMQLDKIPPNLGAGYRLEAEFVVGKHPQVLALPRPALLQKPDGSFYVFKVVAGHLQEQTVELGVSEDLRVSIRSGLAEGDTVVAAPESGLKDGDEVQTPP